MDYKPTWRKPAGMLLILLIIALWAIIIASFSETIGTWPMLVQAIVYVVAGIVWIFPVRPLLTWMELGRFK
jgi:predicted membrane channel-forming protein YqfA (hemolysin III family)